MSKNKVSLENRKRLRELQQDDVTKTTADIRREQVQSMREMHVVPAEQLALTIEQLISDVVLELSNLHYKWSQPMDNNRYRYSPNERRVKLLQELKMILAEISDWLTNKGFHGNECVDKCQEITDRITEGLRMTGVNIGKIYLFRNNKHQGF